MVQSVDHRLSQGVFARTVRFAAQGREEHVFLERLVNVLKIFPFILIHFGIVAAPSATASFCAPKFAQRLHQRELNDVILLQNTNVFTAMSATRQAASQIHPHWSTRYDVFVIPELSPARTALALQCHVL